MNSIFWFRRDLRLQDNLGLHTAQSDSKNIIPLYIHSPEEEAPWERGSASCVYLNESLLALQSQFLELGTDLAIDTGDSFDAIMRCAKKYQVSRVYWNRLYEPILIKRDKALKEKLIQAGIEVKIAHDHSLYPLRTISNKVGEPYKVFSPFWRTLSQHIQSAKPATGLYQAPQSSAFKNNQLVAEKALQDLKLDTNEPWQRRLKTHFSAGAMNALDQLESFKDGMKSYPTDRDIPAVSATSRLSTALHFGEISPWRIFHELNESWQGQDGAVNAQAAEGFLRQVAWREFAIQWLNEEPECPTQSIKKSFDSEAMWIQNADFVSAWQKGNVGYPIIDAGMSELWQTGIMHNRVRMIVASFLTKNLGQHWIHGARWFWDTLIDADLANNTMGWQWVAGCGCDAAPYYRIFNPERQALMYDKNGDYQQRWLVSKAPPINPIIDLSTSRQDALERYKQVKLISES